MLEKYEYDPKTLTWVFDNGKEEFKGKYAVSDTCLADKSLKFEVFFMPDDWAPPEAIGRIREMILRDLRDAVYRNVAGLDRGHAPVPKLGEGADKGVKRPGANNAIFMIRPYSTGNLWAFDDPDRGLTREPFVGKVSVMIDWILDRVGLPPRKPFTLLFSDRDFPNSMFRFDKEKEERDGAWYRCDEIGRNGWLCPALLLYFEKPPETIYIALS